jgi:hypothetical protein
VDTLCVRRELRTAGAVYDVPGGQVFRDGVAGRVAIQ